MQKVGIDHKVWYWALRKSDNPNYDSAILVVIRFGATRRIFCLQHVGTETFSFSSS
jgi:hypothetical protein